VTISARRRAGAGDDQKSADSTSDIAEHHIVGSVAVIREHENDD
jgi:hypothetical protein